jgi:hypothetical protein
MSESVNIKILTTGGSDADLIRATVSRGEPLATVSERVFPSYPGETTRIRWIYLGRTIESNIPEVIEDDATFHVSITRIPAGGPGTSTDGNGRFSPLDKTLLTFINSVCVILFALLWRQYWAKGDQFSTVSTGLLFVLSAILTMSILSQFRSN